MQENDAHQRLIAAAPDLLAACKELREALAGAMRVLHNELLDEVFVEEMAALGIRNGIGVRAEHAIRKAEGA